ncbi:hypothetical protein ACHAWF_013361 [Thalassiosira exigua]
MGCSASSHAGVPGSVGGIYSLPTDEGDVAWHRDSHYGGGVGGAGRAPRGAGGVGGARPGSAPPDDRDWGECSQHQRCPSEAAASACHRGGEGREVVVPCGSLAPMHCPNASDATAHSPERKPLRLRRTNRSAGDGAVDVAPATRVAANDSSIEAPPSSSSAYEGDCCDRDAPPAFAARRWLVLPERRYDLDAPHPPLPPFLGGMYWTDAGPCPSSSTTPPAGLTGPGRGRGGRGRGGPGGAADFCPVEARSRMPSLISPSPRSSSSATEAKGKEGAAPPRVRRRPWPEQRGSEKLLPSLDSAEEEWDGELGATSASGSSTEGPDGEAEAEADRRRRRHHDGDEAMNPHSPRTSINLSQEMLNYSALEGSYELDPLQTPRRLFDGEDTVTEDTIMAETVNESQSFEVVPISLRSPGEPSSAGSEPRRGLQSLLCYAPVPSMAKPSSSGAPLTPRQASRRNHSPAPPSSPNVATFYGHWGSRRERHVSTLPSPKPGEPVRLRVTEMGGHRGAGGIGRCTSSHSQGSTPRDYYSYDPYFSTGKYSISSPGGRPYGNGTSVRMAGRFMILEDSRGAVWAVVKSRQTQTPSAVVYAPKARFGGQVASGHQLTRRAAIGKRGRVTATVVDGDRDGAAAGGEALFPWALISKGGRTMRDDCAVHLANDEAGGGGAAGIFGAAPSFRGRHCFDRGLHTHTVVSRTAVGTAQFGGGKSPPLEGGDGVPCCVIVRDPNNLDAVDVTIAPGIDPLLMICYLASHSKMDVEPIMGGY